MLFPRVPSSRGGQGARYGQRANISVVRDGNVVIQRTENSVQVRIALISIYTEGERYRKYDAHLSAFSRCCSLSRVIKQAPSDKLQTLVISLSLSLSLPLSLSLFLFLSFFSRLIAALNRRRLLRDRFVRISLALGAQCTLTGHEISVTPSR